MGIGTLLAEGLSEILADKEIEQGKNKRGKHQGFDSLRSQNHKDLLVQASINTAETGQDSDFSQVHFLVSENVVNCVLLLEEVL
jgi:hypothetical protein